MASRALPWPIVPQFWPSKGLAPSALLPAIGTMGKRCPSVVKRKLPALFQGQSKTGSYPPLKLHLEGKRSCPYFQECVVVQEIQILAGFRQEKGVHVVFLFLGFHASDAGMTAVHLRSGSIRSETLCRKSGPGSATTFV